MVSVALERRVISSFWGVAHWDPGGVQRRRESKMRKEEELLELFRAPHLCTCPRNSWLHVSGVPVLVSNTYPCLFLWVAAIVHALLFLCPFHFVLGSYHRPQLLFSSGLRLQSDAVCLRSSRLALCCRFRRPWLTKGVCVFMTLSVHLLNKRRLCACALFWPQGQHLE